MLNTTKLKKKYMGLEPEVSEYMSSLIDNLSKEYGADLESSWEASLDMCADWYDIYIKALNSIKIDGAVVDGIHGKKINPAFEVLKAATKNVNDTLRSFAANPVAKTRMRALGKNVNPMNENDFLNSLTGS